MSTPERDALIEKVREALWAALERQAEEPMGPYVDREFGHIDTSGGGDIDMTALAEAAFDVLIDAWAPPW
ncbi:hypothetical protein HWC44_gp089 [Mycobacterium phage ThetaBob]|uniref:Uncharacterized protein n=1 Tax=Mycobacterium phage ThetaBob TaxID=2588513 RepID=A0A4Y6EMP1_9CAUD|nr:hypothetical protein HWC44_gp089 [Mycobacterium phage ThetaBob]QDF19976.1 hypothetical protein SEA_THETABOB_89 [Mycobacterium phage ThetaBob]